jgi:hypothetical protein
MIAMEEGRSATPSIAERPVLTRTDSQDFDIEEGRANPQVAIDVNTTPSERPTLMRSNTGELNAMETGSVDVESGFGAGKGGRKTRKGRKGRKTRKGGKRRKSHRR